MEKRNRRVEIPDVVRKLMEENRELESFISLLLEENVALFEEVDFLKKQNHELKKQIRKLERVLDEIIDSDVKGLGERGTCIRVRPAAERRRRTSSNEAHHEGVTRPVPAKIDIVKNETCRMRGMSFMDFGRSYLEARLDGSGLPKG